jgi:ABC-type dipeptide/oligopeptide/nickel transport system ATPase component
VSSGSIHVAGHEVTQTQDRSTRRALAGLIGFVFQEPSLSLNPAMRVGSQLSEADRTGTHSSRWSAAVERLAGLKVPAADLRARQFPHELSGGTLQRAMTAMALTGEPQLIIADEPTTALDVTVEAAALRTLDEVLTSTGAALLLISHDLAVVCELCPRIVVMHEGRIVEDIATVDLLRGQAVDPYTRSLLADASGVVTR